MREDVIKRFKERMASITVPLPVQNNLTEESDEKGKKGDSNSDDSSINDFVKMAALEKFVADHMDQLCIVVLPLTYAFMTVIIFGFV